MYLPQQFVEARLDVLHDLIRAHPLGTLVVCADAALCAEHIPFLLHADGAGGGRLHGHVSRANPVWSSFSGSREALVIFHGPQAYVSPAWYSSRAAHGRVVPTWNYAVVHAYGTPRAVQDPAWLLRHVAQLTGAHEAGQARPWRVAEAPNDYMEQMIGGIVGVEIALARLEGKWKVSQNRMRSDQLGVVAGLQQQGTDDARAMAELVMQRLNAP
jgi:transcriptional regulator